MDITFHTECGRFNYRVVGLLIHDNKLLVMKDENSPYFYIPGGRVQMNETSEEALKREFREELETEVTVSRVLWVVENFFTEDATGERFHEIGFYYLLNLADESILSKGNTFTLTEGGKHTLEFSWKPIEEIPSLYLYPLFIKDKIANLPDTVEHIIECK